MISIYMSDVRSLDCNNEKILSFMSDYRLNKLKSTSNENVRRLYAGAELLLCYALKKAHGDTPLPLDIKGSPKPYIDGVNFSLSHSKGFAACAVATQNIGLDIEKINPLQSHRVGKKFLTGDELKLLTRDNFFDLWTKKESCLKLYGFSSFADAANFNVLTSDVCFNSFTEYGYKITVASEMPDTAVLYSPDIEDVIRFLLN